MLETSTIRPKARRPSGEKHVAKRRGGRQEIRVVNKIPSTFLYVMKEQFALMKAWMEPLDAHHRRPGRPAQADARLDPGHRLAVR